MNVSPYIPYFTKCCKPAEMSVVNYLIRQMKKPDQFVEVSMGEIAEESNISRSHVARQLMSLDANKVVKKYQRCPACSNIVDNPVEKCPECHVNLDSRHLVYKFMQWPDDVQPEETFEERTERRQAELSRSAKATNGKLDDLKSKFDTLNNKMDRLNDNFERFVGIFERYAPAIAGGAPKPNEISDATLRLIEDTLGAYAEEVSDDVATFTSNSEPCEDEYSDDQVMDDWCASFCDPEAGEQNVSDPSSTGNTMYVRSSSLFLNSESDTRSKVLLRNKRSPVATGSRILDPNQLRNHVSDSASASKSLLDQLLSNVESDGSRRSQILRAARLLNERLDAQQRKWDDYKRDADSGFFWDEKPKAPYSVRTRARFAADVIQNLYGTREINMLALQNEIKKRGFLRYVEEQIDFFDAEMAKKVNPVFIPHHVGQKVNLATAR